MLYQCLGSGYEIQREGNPYLHSMMQDDTARHVSNIGRTTERSGASVLERTIGISHDMAP
jgi:hypothetical protein